MKRKTIFRTEVSASIGMGHLVRCLSLAKMLESHFGIRFLLDKYEPKVQKLIESHGFDCDYLDDVSVDGNPASEVDFLDKGDIIVLDGYDFKSAYQRKIKNAGKILVYIDDIHSFHMYADVVINVSDSVVRDEYSAESYTRYLLGSNYALLREPFLMASRLYPRVIDSVNSVFISMGGADINNLSLKILKAIRSIDSLNKVHILLGAVNPNERELENYLKSEFDPGKVTIHKNIDAAEVSALISCCQLVICPASGISMEASSIGVGIISGFTADNQTGILQGLVKKECIFNAGNFNVLSSEEISRMIRNYIGNLGLVNTMIRNQKKLIDGNSPQRYLSVFKEL